MSAAELLTTLKKLGKPVTAAIYKRHGSGDNVFGVLTSDVAKMQKKIGIDHELAKELWATENAEARMLALQIFDPQKMTRAFANKLLKDKQAHFLAWYICGLLARSPIAHEIMHAWMIVPGERHREIGYGILSVVLKHDPNSISDAGAESIMARIEAGIHHAPNWARYSMNSALISIGAFKPALRQNALATAKRIGKVDVDHGETTCKTPDAASYIAKASKRRR
jgi:3-methyladenine DNA glycosylase AlkD